ncbi:L-histidine N(alpha)-methyltransferase [Nannocystis sp. SCPEA4]|uniref:class I SAM-dependent methyltransferase n=1 Tax=Nannocystis sp. SCPEA4 TaxID=2996787 RepID=UPI00226FC22C|nr:L-histidine N(alpha)-methyltransferase [Nannocystis sp. SCPEA4]
MTSSIDRMRAAWRFFLNGWRDWDQTASFVPSSRFLVDALVQGADLGRARSVVELGTGTGTVTEKLLAAMRPDARLYGVEIDGPLLEATARRLPDPRLVAIHGSAADLAEHLAAAGEHGKVDAIVSCLGMSLLPPELRDAIIDSAARVLAPGGVFVQYGYLHAHVIVYSTSRGFSQFHLGRYLGRYFAEQRRQIVVPNIPPAEVLVCRGSLPRDISAAA